ncbi:hypothetical protein P5706_13145 [Pseudomonas sp. ChxA]|uniref:hypothetical protein n=1 Tax=Pseudomonas sp. ChxA TaxID=3035473 RepID=UPI002554D285|nr:hypothetical protein [Pseudomonas sp. ChxA]MDL2185127.1 hypothetical protein [Pseudomonas sp. ChxA]
MSSLKSPRFKKIRSVIATVLVVVIAGFVLRYYEAKDEANIAFQEYLRSNQQVTTQIGNVASLTLLKRFVYDESDTGPGFHLYLYLVKGEHGSMTVEVKRIEGNSQIVISDIQE